MKRGYSRGYPISLDGKTVFEFYKYAEVSEMSYNRYSGGVVIDEVTSEDEKYSILWNMIWYNQPRGETYITEADEFLIEDLARNYIATIIHPFASSNTAEKIKVLEQSGTQATITIFGIIYIILFLVSYIVIFLARIVRVQINGKNTKIHEVIKWWEAGFGKSTAPFWAGSSFSYIVDLVRSERISDLNNLSSSKIDWGLVLQQKEGKTKISIGERGIEYDEKP